MAQQDQKLSGGVQVTYTISGTKDVTIDVYNSDGFILTSVSSGARDINSNISFCIDASISNLNGEIRDYTAAISTLKTQVAVQQKIYDNPASTPEQKQAALKKTQTLQGQIVDKNVQIKEANIAITGINAKGKSILTGLIPRPETSPVKPAPAPTPAPTPAPAAAPTKAKLVGAADGDSGAKQANPVGTTGAPPNQKTVASTAAKTTGGTTKKTSNPNVSAPNGPSIPPNAKTAEAVGSKIGNAFVSSGSTASQAREKVASSGEPRNNATGSGPSPADSVQTVDSAPGRRPKNPLGQFASYTYQLSLYMITPDAYDLFVNAGRTNINVFSQQRAGETDSGGAFLIAQSGGINNTNSKRAPGFEFDYYIDSLSLHSMTGGPSTQAATNITQPLTFKIIEPYGFSFITHLRETTDKIAEYSKNLVPRDPMKQFFILGVRFLGYDIDGNLMSGQSKFGDGVLDPSADDSGLFETFYDITIVSMSFKIDGKAVIYEIEAAPQAPSVAFGVKKGMTHVPYTVTANTVGEALNQLMEKINKNQSDMHGKAISKKNTYQIDWSAPGAEQIKNSSIVSPADLDKSKWAGSGAKTSSQSNAAQELKEVSKTNFRQLTFKEDTSILQAINAVISQSSYLEDALKVVSTTALESDPKSKSYNYSSSKTNQNISWYNCSTAVSNAVWDEMISDWAYTITYKIQKYETPVVNSPLTNPGIDYYGPHKRYDYWYTGKNSEILQYEQTLNNTYFNSVAGLPDTSTTSTGGTNPSGSATSPAAGSSGNASDGPKSVTKAPGIMSQQPRLGKTGYGMEAQNSYLTSLYDPVSLVDATIKIMGDPDFLVQESEATDSKIYNRFYGSNGFTVNCNGGQVFVEIDFNEAVDYGIDGPTGGTMKINHNVMLYNYPESITKIVKGLSYIVIAVDSSFQNGSFTQTLTLKLNDFGAAGATTNDSARPAQPNTNPPAGAAPNNNAAAKGSTGTTQSPNFNSSTPTGKPTNTSNKSPSQPTSKTGPSAKPVADDDGGKR